MDHEPKCKKMKLLERIMRRFQDPGLGKEFLALTPET